MSKKRKNLTPHPHIDCQKAKVMQYGNDPLVVQCGVNGERHVASTATTCPYFIPRQGEPIIEHHRKRIGISDYYE